MRSGRGVFVISGEIQVFVLRVQVVRVLSSNPHDVGIVYIIAWHPQEVQLHVGDLCGDVIFLC